MDLAINLFHPVQRQNSTPGFDLVHNFGIPVGFGLMTANLPTNRALVLDTTVPTAAFQRIVLIVGTVDPRMEQSDVAIGTASARTEGTNKVTRLQVLPIDAFGDLRETDSVSSWGARMESHGDEA